jgi:hypothetical protein
VDAEAWRIALYVDMYNFRARQNPVTIALARGIFAALVVVPELQSVWGFLGGVVAALGLPYCFAQAAGNAGKRLEPGLYEAWGGKPSTAMLRHRNGRINEITKQAYFDLLRQVGIPMPTPQDEALDPLGADKAYETAGDWLRRETRDPKSYPRVKTELTNFGLVRNLLGLRRVGLSIAIISVLVQALLVAVAVVNGGAVAQKLVLSLVFSAAMIGFWLRVVDPAWVRRTAEAYALALLEACERRRVPSATPKKPSAAKKRSGGKVATHALEGSGDVAQEPVVAEALEQRSITP